MREMSAREALKAGESLAGHIAAVVIGAAMMIGGVGMGVTMILIPVGVPVGLVGLGLFLWGVWGFREARSRRAQP
jgi:high-affinity Fe2+/Pb2+ permease